MVRSVVSGIVALWIATASVSAVTRMVPGEYPYIQTAIQDCNDGDTVVVEPGVYYETINFGGKDIVVTSTDPNDPKIVGYTVINADEDGTPVTFENGETPAAVLTGFTITGGVGTVNNDIEDTGAGATFWGGGIYCIGASPTITKNVISGNHAPFRLDVIAAQDAQMSWGGGIACIGCNPVITHNIIRRNSAYIAGGLITYLGEPIISNNLIYDNSAGIGGGVILVGGSLCNNTIVGNASGLGGFDSLAGNLYIVSDPTIGFWQVSNNVICNALSGGGVLVVGEAPADRFTFNNVWGNVPGDYAVANEQTGAVAYDGPSARTGMMGNISADPMFVNPFGRDYRLTMASPCVNAGDPAAVVPAGLTDLDGNARVYAFRLDMGAYEYTGYVKPVAFAGYDQHVLSPMESVMLDGRQSYFYDPCGVTKFQWAQIEGSPVALSDPNCATPMFMPETMGRYEFELVVADDQYTSQPDQVLVLVAENGPPVASAGVDRVWQAPGTVTLDGTGSYDLDGVDRLSFRWRQVEGSPVELRDPNIATASFLCDVQGQYVFELIVSDGFADSQPSQVRHLTVPVTKDLQEKTIMPAGTVGCYHPDISGGRVVFTTGQSVLTWQITCKDLYADQATTFTGGGTNLQPKIDGDLVVWWGGAFPGGTYAPDCTSVFVRDVVSGTQQTLRARSETASYSHPAISGRKVVWVQHLDLDKTVPEKWYATPYDICGADISNLQKPRYFNIAAGAGRCDPFPLDDPVGSPDIVGICGDIVVWEGQGDIFAADISDLNDIRVFPVCEHPARQYDPAISGRFVVWTDERNDRGDIYGADLSDLGNIREMEIVKRSGSQQQPAIDGGMIAYAEGQGYSGTLRLACVTRQHGVLDTDLPQLPSGTSPALEGTTLVMLQSLYSSIQGLSLGVGYSIPDGSVQNSRSGARYDYVQHAILDSEPGDEVVVAQGCYAERINYAGKALTVRSTNPVDPAVVAATTLRIEGDVVTFAALEDANSILDGLTITGGCNGIVCSGTSSTVTRCHITANRGPGVRLLNQSNVAITHCTIAGNEGPGIDMWATRQGRVARHSEAMFLNCIIAGNRLQGISSGRVTITNCTIVENLREGVNSVSPVVTNSILYSNGASSNGTQIGGSYATVSFSDIEGGWAGDGNIDADPYFVETGNWADGTAWRAGDYHLKSQGRRWDSLSSSWVSDAVTSPCIDAGDPAHPLLDEPVTITQEPDGQQCVNTRIDMGAYGGTAEASLVP